MEWLRYPPIPDKVIDVAIGIQEKLPQSKEVFPTGRETVQFEFVTDSGTQVEMEVFDEDTFDLFTQDGPDLHYEENIALEEVVNKLDI